ncbi:MAG: MFS transporter [Syntrophales bacterium]
MNQKLDELAGQIKRIRLESGDTAATPMSRPKIIFFLVELINSYAAVYYANFLFFYVRDRFGFTELENLLLAALSGLVYVFAAWQGGAFAERFGYVRGLCVGLTGVAISLAAGLFWDSVAGQVIVFAAWTISICFTWPALSAIVSEGGGARLSDMVGIYNITWAVGAAVAYFTAGLLLERLGMASLFWLPLCLVALQGLLVFLAVRLRQEGETVAPVAPETTEKGRTTDSRRLLHMAWLANPLSYVAINTVLPLIPSISETLGLSTAAAGILCSVWMFARLAAFGILWRWTGWHYHSAWLLGSFAVMTACFAGFVRPSSLSMLLASQVGFGLSIGLIYYSSLFYSMNASEEKGTHGGLHEAIIGTGLFVGPACGASSLFLFPSLAVATWPVTGLLIAGLAGLAWMGQSKK